MIQDRSLLTVPELEFTGERIVPGKTVEPLFQEHEVRYRFAVQFAVGKDVLDVACGTGVGTAHLRREGARKAYGIDIDAEAIAFARARYPDCQFLEGDASNLSLSDSSVDVVVSYETLEHLRNQKGFFRECCRVIRPGGMLICSTPNTTLYRWLGANPYHIHELSACEFDTLLRTYFCDVHLFSQSEHIYPLFALKRVASNVLSRLSLRNLVKKTLHIKAPPAEMRDAFSSDRGRTFSLRCYRHGWWRQPMYVVATARKAY